jgi:PIN domain nuclease of toxin-antitoxin system
MTGRPILLDTCALLWLGRGDLVELDALAAFQAAAQEPGGVLVSPISAWEVGQLVSRGRMRLSMDPQRWFEGALATGLRLAAMPPGVLIASSYLPNSKLRDPADKILAATAREFDYRLMTRDRPLLEYAAEGHLNAIVC